MCVCEYEYVCECESDGFYVENVFRVFVSLVCVFVSVCLDFGCFFWTLSVSGTGCKFLA